MEPREVARQIGVTELGKENAELRKRIGIAAPAGRGVSSEEAMKQGVDEIPLSLESRRKSSQYFTNSVLQMKNPIVPWLGRCICRWYSVQKEKGNYTPVCANEW